MIAIVKIILTMFEVKRYFQASLLLNVDLKKSS